MAKAIVNGQEAGICTGSPYAVEITRLLRPATRNIVEVVVAAAAQHPLRAVGPNGVVELAAAGLIGPVRLVIA